MDLRGRLIATAYKFVLRKKQVLCHKWEAGLLVTERSFERIFMMKQFKEWGVIVVAAVLVFLAFGSEALAKESLQIVPNQKVCMVTNMVFPRDQIPVSHAGKTYYGCCENCKKTLAEDASARKAIDPVTGKSIDKATAVIAARADGSVVYFENKASFERYSKNK